LKVERLLHCSHAGSVRVPGAIAAGQTQRIVIEWSYHSLGDVRLSLTLY
jgi:hypothetical protein